MKCRWPMMDSYGGIILMQPSFRIHSSLKLLPTIPCLNFPPDLRRTFHRYLSSHPPLGPFQSISLVQSLASGVTWPQCLLLLAHPPTLHNPQTVYSSSEPSPPPPPFTLLLHLFCARLLHQTSLFIWSTSQ